jgi:acetyl esterase/lipase
MKFFFTLSLLALVALLQAEPPRVAEKAVAALQKGKYKAFSKYCNPKFREQMNAAQLTQFMGKVTQTYGNIRSITYEATQKKEGVEVHRYRLQMEKDSFTLLVSVDKDQISGMFIRPFENQNQYKKPRYGTGFPVSVKDVEHGVEGWQLPAQLVWPARFDTARLPVCIFVHGSGPNDMDESMGPNKPFLDLALGLAGQGIGSLRYHKRTFQYASRYKDVVLTPEDEVYVDLWAMIYLVKQQDWVDTNRIFIVGHSQGAMMAPRFASLRNDIAGVVMLCGTSDSLSRIVEYQINHLNTQNGNEGSEQSADMMRQLRSIYDPAQPENAVVLGTSVAWWRHIDTIFRPEFLGATPHFVVNATKDYQVPPRFYSSLRGHCEARSNTERHACTFREYPNLNHLLQESDGSLSPNEYRRPDKHVDEQLIKDIAVWIRLH